GLVQLDELYKSASFWAQLDSANLDLIAQLNTIILAFAKQDNMVILGRGGFAVLREYANVLHVRIQAPFAVRVQRVMARENLTLPEAEKRVAQNDKARARFVQGFYDADFYSTRAFHLVLDTGLLPLDTATAWIIEATHHLTNRLPGAITTQQIEVDPILARAIQEVLHVEQESSA
ncbi:MAG TPA: cytidylate kinase-like family protein, partial [Anaerolineales bacterium]|nr:cytidylate kinase-like family protein [Anaerolineales bacterium]